MLQCAELPAARRYCRKYCDKCLGHGVDMVRTDTGGENSTPRRVLARSSIVSSGLRMLSGPVRTPLIRDGYALITSAGLTSVLGLVFWLLAARLHTAAELGRGAALITTLVTLANLAQLGFGNMLNKFLPAARANEGRLVLTAYATAAGAAVLISVCFLWYVQRFYPQLAFLVGDLWMAAWFVLSTAAWALFLLEDSMLSGMRRSLWVPVANTVYALAKIVALVLLAGTALTRLGPFAAWTLPVFGIVAGVNFLAFRYLLGRRGQNREPRTAVDFGKFLGFLGWDYAGTLAMMAVLGIVPLLILNVAGPAANASYHLAWTIAYSLYLVGRSMSISLLAEGSADQQRLSVLAADAFLHAMLLMGAGVVLVVICAPLIMGLFGPSYAVEATPLLRLLALSCLPWGCTTIYLAMARARGNMRSVATIQTATMFTVLGLGWPLLGHFGSIGMGIAWLASHTLVAAGIAVFELAKGGRDGLIGWLLEIAAAGARLAAAVGRSFNKPHTETDGAFLQELLGRSGEQKASSWRVLGGLPSRGSVSIEFVGHATGQEGLGGSFDTPEGTCAVLKIGLTARGSASLVRQRNALEQLIVSPQIEDCLFKIPEILVFKQTQDTVWSIERRVPGKDGRQVVQHHPSRSAALAAASDAINSLHLLSGRLATIDETWVDRWIDGPASLLCEPVHTLMSREQRRRAIDAFTQRQREYWLGRDARLGWYHGDFSPGNVLFRTDDGLLPHSFGAGPDLVVEGIIDWDRAGQDGPTGFDICQLALTSRRVSTGQQIGEIVRNLHLKPNWSDEEKAWFGRCKQPFGPSGDWTREAEALRAMVALVWLWQIIANIEKSEDYLRNRLWAATNVERVLQLFPDNAS